MSGYVPVMTGSALRALERIPPRHAAPLVEFIFGGLASDPRRRGKPLDRELSGSWGARRGDYRVIYRLDDGTRTMFVLFIAHRSDVYRSR